MSRHAPDPPAPGPVRPFDFPAIQSRRLGDEHGLSVLAARHGDLPLVTARLVLDAGAATEPDGAEGVARLTANAVETGTADRSARDLSWDLERLGVELDTDTGWDFASLAVTVPTERLRPAVALLAEIARQPVFPEDQVDRLRDEQSAALLQRRKEPRALADDMAARFIFAPGVPYARPVLGTAGAVTGLDRHAVTDFYDRRFRPGSAALVLTGDIDGPTAADLAEADFGDWDAGSAPPTEVDVRPRADRTTVFLVHRPEAVQSEIRIGHVGVERLHDDYFPLRVVNTILGGAFTSRLNMNLREKHGFTYGARSHFSFRRRPGPFVVSAAVATDVTARAVEEAFGELDAIRNEGVTHDELDTARDFLRGVLPLNLQTTGQLAARITEIFTFRLPVDYFQHFRDRIADVSKDDADRASRQHIHTDRLAIVIVGDADRIAEPLRDLDLGQVEIHEVP